MAILRCTESFTADVDGVPRVVGSGDLLDSSDPVVAGRESLFEPLESFMDRRPGVEQATAAPGEVRTVKRPGRPKS